MLGSLREVKDARVIFLDMNSFFASVEQQYRPELRDHPLAVVSHDAPRGTVLAASYAAKAFGVKTGTRLGDARMMCPGLAVTETTPGLYKEVHYKFMDILRDRCGPEVFAKSIDEAAIFLSPNWADSETAWEVARDIKERFRNELGEYIKCSIGIAPNSLLGKVASNLQKPDGLTEINLANLEEVLGRLELTDLPGIATRNAARLALIGISTPLDLYSSTPEFLQANLGIFGRYWWWRLHGYEADPGEERLIKNMSHQHVLTHWLYDFEAVWPIISRMADRLVHRLRRNGLRCRSVWLYLRLSGAASLSAEIKLDSPCDSYPALLGALRQMLEAFPRPLLGAIRQVSMGFNGLSITDGLQLDLFQQRPRHEQISKALEDIRGHYGFQAIQMGNVVRLDKKVAKEELGFGRLKDRNPSLVSKGLT